MLRTIIGGSILIACSSAMAVESNATFLKSGLGKESYSKGLLFSVQSNPKGKQVPVTVCLDITKKNKTCQNYPVSITEMGIMAMKRNGQDKSYSHAGMRIDAKGYKLEGCKLLDNDFCEFEVSTKKPTVLKLSAA